MHLSQVLNDMTVMLDHSPHFKDHSFEDSILPLSPNSYPGPENHFRHLPWNLQINPKSDGLGCNPHIQAEAGGLSKAQDQSALQSEASLYFKEAKPKLFWESCFHKTAACSNDKGRSRAPAVELEMVARA